MRAWAVAGDLDVTDITSNTFTMQWPPRSGEMREFPEVDRAQWFGLDEARAKLNPAQVPFVDRLVEAARAVSGSDAISPTAHYTGEVWRRNGLSHPRLATREGRVMYDALHPLMGASGALGGPSLETYLLARHRAIDALLERCDRAPRRHPGGRDRRRHVAARMALRQPLRRPAHLRRGRPAGDGRPQAAGAASGSDRCRTAIGWWSSMRCAPRGAGSLAELAAQLDPGQGLAIITEGLLGYLPTEAVLQLWTRLARRP